MDHLALFWKRYLDLIGAGIKTEEIRCSMVKGAPYHTIDLEDTIYCKQTSKSVIKILFDVANVEYHEFTGETEVIAFLNQHREALQIDDAFIEKKKLSRYCTLIYITNVRFIDPIPFTKKDRRAWIPNFQLPE